MATCRKLHLDLFVAHLGGQRQASCSMVGLGQSGVDRGLVK